MKKASIRQIQALHYMSNGLSKRQSMIRAGYSISTANQATRVLKTQSMHQLIDTFQDKLNKLGITPDYVAAKLVEWFDATKIVNGHIVPDYEIQTKAYDICFKILKESEEPANKPERKIKLETWLSS